MVRKFQYYFGSVTAYGDVALGATWLISFSKNSHLLAVTVTGMIEIKNKSTP